MKQRTYVLVLLCVASSFGLGWMLGFFQSFRGSIKYDVDRANHTVVESTKFLETRKYTDSPNRLREDSIDSNHDGIVDEWIVTFRKGAPEGMMYMVADNDFNGKIDEVVFNSEDWFTIYAMLTKSLEGKRPNQVFRISDRRTTKPESHARVYQYVDQNLDGRIDMYRVGTAAVDEELSEHYVLLGATWRRTVTTPTDDENWNSCVILLDNGEQARAVFDYEEGAWKLDEPN